MARTSGRIFRAIVCTGVLLLACLHTFGSVSFTAAPAARSTQGGRGSASRIPRGESSGSYPEVIVDTPLYAEFAITAIEECMAEGLSVESLALLDVKLRSIQEQLARAIDMQTHRLLVTGMGHDELHHLVVVKQRVQTLCDQMQVLQGVLAHIIYHPEHEWMHKQLIQAATDSFGLGGGRKAAAASASA